MKQLYVPRLHQNTAPFLTHVFQERLYSLMECTTNQQYGPAKEGSQEAGRPLLWPGAENEKKTDCTMCGMHTLWKGEPIPICCTFRWLCGSVLFMDMTLASSFCPLSADAYLSTHVASRLDRSRSRDKTWSCASLPDWILVLLKNLGLKLPSASACHPQTSCLVISFLSHLPSLSLRHEAV